MKRMGLSLLLITFCITFCMAFHAAHAEEKTYEVSDRVEISHILNSMSCLTMMTRGPRFMSAILAGLRLGKLKVTDDDGAPFLWPEDAHPYRIKRTLEVFFYDRQPNPAVILKTKPCGVDPLEESREGDHSIWEDQK